MITKPALQSLIHNVKDRHAMTKNLNQIKHPDAVVLAIIAADNRAAAIKVGEAHGVHEAQATRWHRLEERRALRLAIEHGLR